MINPLSDRVILKVLDEKEARGGLWVPDGVRATVAYGKVLAVGPGRCNPNGEFTPMALKKGDTVVFRPNPGDFAIINGEEVIVTYEGEILGTV